MSAEHALTLPQDARAENIVRRQPLASFFVLAYAISWLPGIVRLFTGSGMPIFGAGPFVAAVVVLALTLGKPGVKGLFRAMLEWRVGARWWAVALLLPIVITMIATGLNIALGAPVPTSEELGTWTNVLPTFLLILLVPGIGGAWEEPGWRGYSLPRLLRGRSALSASLVLGVLWALWHVPLFMVGGQHWSDLVLIVAASVVFTWLFQNALGSVLIAMVCHAMNNAVSGNYFSQMFSGADSSRQSWMLVIVWTAAAVCVGIFARGFRTHGPE